MNGKVFLDTNVLVYAHDDATPARTAAANSVPMLLNGISNVRRGEGGRVRCAGTRGVKVEG